MYGERLNQIALFMYEGNTYSEAARAFPEYSKSTIKYSINANLIHQNYELYVKLKNKPYMVIQRVIHNKCSFEEARKAFRVSEIDLHDFMVSFYMSNPKKYLLLYNKYRVEVYNKLKVKK